MSKEFSHYGVKGMKWGIRKKRTSTDYDEYKSLKKKKTYEMSNAELRKFNERSRLEGEYKRLNPSHIKKGLLVAGGAAGTMGTLINLYNNSNTLIKAGKELSNRIVNGVGDMVYNELKKNL